MTRFWLIVLIVLYYVPGVPNAQPDHQASKKERFSQYLAGVEYLDAADGLSAEDKAGYYRKLVEITGFDAETAQAYLKQYQDDPERWLKVIESVIEIINTPTEKKEE